MATLVSARTKAKRKSDIFVDAPVLSLDGLPEDWAPTKVQCGRI